MRKATRYYRCLYLLIPLVLVPVLLFGLPCPPVMAAPIITLSVSSGPVGTSVTITGTVFDSYEGDTIHILFDETEISAINIPAEGSFSFTSEIPADASPGEHIIGAKRETTDSHFFISAAFTVQERLLVISAAEGPVGTGITLAGSGFCINREVTISYENPAANSIGAVIASSDGRLTKTFSIPAGVGGSHRFTASNNAGNTAEAAFKIVPRMVISVDSASPGEFVHIMGSGFGDKSTVSITLDALTVASATSDAFGSFETEFVVPEIPLNNYSLKAQDVSGNLAQAMFPVTAGAVLSDDTGSVGSPVTVVGDGFQPGETVIIYYDDDKIAEAPADANGDFTVTFIVPPSASGDHTITISDPSTTRHYAYSIESQAPLPPILLLPEHNGMAGAYTHFTWEKVTDTSIPVTYSLEIASDRDFTDIVFSKTGILDTGYTLGAGEALAASAADSVYFWRMSAADGAGNRSGFTDIHSFFVDYPAVPALFEPVDNTPVKLPMLLTWQAVPVQTEPVTYNLQVSRNNEFTALIVDEKGITSPSYSITEESRKIFTKKYNYYWRVKAVDNAHNTSAWSNTGSFKIASNGFPAWASWTLSGLAVVIIGLVILRIRRRMAYR